MIGSPMCRAFSQLQRWNWDKMESKKRDDVLREGKDHLRFSSTPDGIGRIFFENLLGATSWREDCMRGLTEDARVKVVKGDMCAFGMYQ